MSHGGRVLQLATFFFFLNGPLLGIEAAVLNKQRVCLNLKLASFPFPKKHVQLAVEKSNMGSGRLHKY